MTVAAATPKTTSALNAVRHDWHRGEIEALFALPFNDLLFRAAQVHREHFDPNAVQVSTLLSIKTGACPEDCKYCSQSGHHNTELEKEKLLEVSRVVEEARAARDKDTCDVTYFVQRRGVEPIRARKLAPQRQGDAVGRRPVKGAVARFFGDFRARRLQDGLGPVHRIPLMRSGGDRWKPVDLLGVNTTA